MEQTIRSVLIIVNTGKDGARELLEEMRAYFRRRSIDVTTFLYEGVARSLPVPNGTDVAITLGGDGTVLFASRILAPHDIPILPVNLGSFGFISEIEREEWRCAFEAFQSGEVSAGRRMVLSAEVIHGGRVSGAFRGLNDAVVSSEGISRIVRLSVYVGEQYLGDYRADGVIVATPTGSTGYSTAAGGPILHPEMDALIVNPICPFTISHRPLVLPATELVRVVIAGEQRTKVALTVDGQSLLPLEANDEVLVRSSPQPVRIVRPRSRTFYEVLRSKLNWSGGGR